MNHQFKFLLGLLVMLPLQSYCQQGDEGAELVTGTIEETEEDIIELLEFLGEFETEEGGWVSPFDLVQDRYTELDEPESNDDNEDEND